MKQHRVIRFLLLILFFLLAAVVLIPLAALWLSSFKEGRELIQYGLNLKIEPEKMSLNNYIYLFTGNHDYFIWYLNSIFLTVVQVGSTLLVSACVGYGFAAYDFKGKNMMFMCVLLILMVPFEILMLPLYNLIHDMKLSNTYRGIVLPFMAHASTIFFFRQYLRGIPGELKDAGRVDGATEYGIFFRLILPVMKPAIALMAIITGLNCWNNFLWPLLVLRDSGKYILPIGLNTLLTPYGNHYDLLIAGSCFSVIPLLILFLFFQKYFIEGMMAGAVKG